VTSVSSIAVPTVPTAQGRLPVIGHCVALKRNPLGFMRSLWSQGDVVRIFVGSRPVYFVNTVELIRQVLVVEARKFDKGPWFAEMRTQMGNGLIISAGEFHRRQRRLEVPAFHPERVARYGEVMAGIVEASTAGWTPGGSAVMSSP
jgi:pentalenene oxygenase